MSAALPADLVTAVRDGRVVLMLGAGASFGAQDESGKEIPMGAQLAADLFKEFLSPDYDGIDFRMAYDLSCSQRDTRTVQRFIRDRIDPFKPIDFHHLIPTFAWAGLVTTNYDLIVERAYSSAGTIAPQRLLPHTKDNDGITSQQDDRTVLYVKLHGCITRYNEIDPPMIASTEQLISFRRGRAGQFDIFLEWSRNKTLIFVGYAFNDNNLRVLLDEIVKEGDNRPRHFIVDPKILPALADYWRDRRFLPLAISFADFLHQLDVALPSDKRILTPLSIALAGATTFTKFMTVSGRIESDDLIQYLRFGIDHVSEDFDPIENGNAQDFFRGFDLGWLPYKLDADVERKISDVILSEQVITRTEHIDQRLILLKGHAGSGKTVSIRRACWDAGKSYNNLCFFVSRDATIKINLFMEIFQLTNLPIFLFIDGASLHRNRIMELLSIAKAQRISLAIMQPRASIRGMRDVRSLSRM